MKFLILTCAAGAALASSSFGTTVLDETFSYIDGPLTDVSLGAWALHSGTIPKQVDVLGGKVNITQAESEDVSTQITPVGTFFNSGILTATFEVNFTTLPTTAGTYFAHYKDASTTTFRGRVFALATGAATGSFRFGIADTTTTVAVIPTDFSLNTTYTLTLSTDAATGRSSLSVNGGTAVTATDATSQLGISTFALRQSANEGIMTIDNLKVDASAAAVPEPAALVMLASGAGMLGLLRRRPLLS